MRRRSLFRGATSALLALAVTAVPWHASSAQDTSESTIRSTSLGWVPSDAAFYTSSMRLGETFQKFVQSKAFDKLKNLEGVKQATKEFERQWNDPAGDFAQAKEVLERPETQRTLAFVGDMASHEMWSYGDMKYADLMELGSQVQVAMREAQFEMQLKEAQGEEPDPMILFNGFIKALDQNQNKIVIPNSITGFKVADVDRAKEQLALLDELIANGVQGNPTLQPAYVKKTVAGTEYMVLDLKGNMVPWQLAGFFLQGIDFASFNRVVGRLNQLELTIALGVKDDHVLLLVGDSAEFLKSLGGNDLLVDRKEFAPLRAMDGKNFTAVAYVSEAYKKRVGNPAEALAAMQQAVEGMLPQLPVNDDLKQEIGNDLKNVAKWVESLDYEPGATLSFEYETPRGYEGYSYDWSKNTVLDGSKPLPLLDHVGGNPVAFVVLRSQYKPEDYDTMTVVLGKAYGYLETFLVGELNDDERAEFQSVMKIVMPHVKKLDATTRNKLMPAMKDGQGAMVLDMKAKSRQWFTEMPPAQRQLAMPQLAFVYGVSDADLLQEAIGDYHEIAQSLIDDLHENDPNKIPKITLPTASKEDVEGGSLYQHMIPPDSGLDPQIAPSAGFGKDVAVWGYMPKQTKQLLEGTALVVDGGPLADTDRNLAAAAGFNFAEFVDGVEPWIEYGVAQYFRSQAVSTEGEFVQFDEPTMDEVIAQMREVAEVLKCFRGYTSATSIEKGATVTHFDYHFEDLE